MKVLLIGNYAGDKQESMGRYANMVQKELIKKSIQVNLIYPPLLFGIFYRKTKVKKWVGYIDKYIVAPIYLFFISKFNSNYDIIHICDHSNAIYRKLFDPKKLVITCHDVLAIRGALGYVDAHCKATRAGVILQKWILNNLINIDKIACVSKTTLKQLIELISDNQAVQKQWKYVPNTFNQSFEPIEIELLKATLRKFNLTNASYMLHVGSDLERKNRSVLLELLSKKKDIQLVVTHPFNVDLLDYKTHANRISILTNLSSQELAAIYQGAFAFLFPSLSEGFGWPIIEAQKSGIPVICSDIPIHREIAGDAAIFVDSEKIDEFVLAIDVLNNQEIRKSLILKGLENIQKYESQIFIDSLIDLYNSNEVLD